MLDLLRCLRHNIDVLLFSHVTRRCLRLQQMMRHVARAHGSLLRSASAASHVFHEMVFFFYRELRCRLLPQPACLRHAEQRRQRWSFTATVRSRCKDAYSHIESRRVVVAYHTRCLFHECLHAATYVSRFTSASATAFTFRASHRAVAVDDTSPSRRHAHQERFSSAHQSLFAIHDIAIAFMLAAAATMLAAFSAFSAAEIRATTSRRHDWPMFISRLMAIAYCYTARYSFRHSRLRRHDMLLLFTLLPSAYRAAIPYYRFLRFSTSHREGRPRQISATCRRLFRFAFILYALRSTELLRLSCSR